MKKIFVLYLSNMNDKVRIWVKKPSWSWKLEVEMHKNLSNRIVLMGIGIGNANGKRDEIAIASYKYILEVSDVTNASYKVGIWFVRHISTCWTRTRFVVLRVKFRVIA